MDFIQLVILSLVQGITEFLPVSSSAHLILVPVLTEWQDQGLMFDVAAHLGTLFCGRDLLPHRPSENDNGYFL